MVHGFEDEIKLKKFEECLLLHNEMMYHLWKVGLNLALRVSDVTKITIDDCISYLESGMYTSFDKKTKKINICKLNDIVINSFLRALKIRSEIKINVDNRYLFIGTGNRSLNTLNPITQQAVYSCFKKVLDINNIYDFGIGTHTMRKTFATLAFKKGVSISTISKKLNHNNERDTVDYIGLKSFKLKEDDLFMEM